MTRKEMAYLMAIIKTAYPEYYRQTNEIEDTINLWQEMMQDDDVELIGLAVKEFIKTDTKGFPPKIGQIKDIAKYLKRKQREEREMVEQQKRLVEPKREPTKEDMEMAGEFIRKIRESITIKD